jgi:hypothetical protein
MAKPTQVTLNKKQQSWVLSSYFGNKTRKPTCNARLISERYGLPVRQVMFFLEEQGLNMYSEGTYR